MLTRQSFLNTLATLAAFVLAACTSTLVEDPKHQVSADVAHCEGSEVVNDSSVAVLPVPIVAFFVPHADTNEIKAQEYLNRCGEPAKLKNREVTVNRMGCIPAGLTRIVTLGVWQWCPANVSWEADVAPASVDRTSGE